MYLLYRKCEYSGCEETILGDDATCDFCGGVRCLDHDTLPFHICCSMDHKVVDGEIQRSFREMWERFLPPLDHIAFERQASQLRPGRSCHVDIPPTAEAMEEAGMFNQFNGHFPLLFDDGVKWLVRLRQMTNYSATGEIQSLVTASEAHTMRVLHSAGLLVPDAWTVAEDERLELKPGTKYDYFFVECAEGESWKKLSKSSGGGNPPIESLKAFIGSYARFQVALSDVRFDRIGSLIPDPESGETTVGPLISPFGFNRPDPPHFFGPFKTNRERYLAHIDLVLELVGTGVYMREDPVFGYLAHLYMRDLVCDLEELGTEETEFYIKHADDKADQCLAIEDEITAVVDWEWSADSSVQVSQEVLTRRAYVTTKAEAFSAPKFCFGSAKQLDVDNTRAREETLLIEAYEELGRQDLADCVRNGRIYNRLNICVGYQPIVRDINALTRTAYGKEATAMVCSTEEEWIAAAKERYRNNETLQRLIREDEGQEGPRAARFAEVVARLTAWRDQWAAEEEQEVALGDMEDMQGTTETLAGDVSKETSCPQHPADKAAHVGCPINAPL